MTAQSNVPQCIYVVGAVRAPEWRREWIADEQPPHNCRQEAVWFDGPEEHVCGVCGVEVVADA